VTRRHPSDTAQPSFLERERWLRSDEGTFSDARTRPGRAGMRSMADRGGRELSVVLAYPERYAIGMSNLGMHAALRAFRSAPGVRCERAFWPCASVKVESDGFAGVAPEPAVVDRFPEAAGRSLETGRPLSTFDVVAFSVSFEGDYFNLVRMLAAGGLEPMARERNERSPLVVVGGVCAHLNPAPIAPFVDAFLIGDADALVESFVEVVAMGNRGGSDAGGGTRRELLETLATLPGAYVPSVPPSEPVSPARWAGRWAESLNVSPDAYFKNMFLTEISRGCARGCRFCAAGEIHRPVRFRPADEVVASVKRGLEVTRRVGLVSAALGDHPDIVEILETMRALDMELNISSLRMEAVTPKVAGLLAACGVRTATIAPEAGSEELRRRIGKSVSDEVVVEVAGRLASHGIRKVRAYFMTGLPGAGEGEVVAIARLCERIQGAVHPHGTRLSVSLSPFVPKPRTPLQWAAMAPERDHRRSLSETRRLLAGFGVQTTSAGPREAVREAALARGGEELAEVIRLAALEDVPWKAAASRAGVDLTRLVHRERDAGEIFPWEVVDVGRSRETLRRAYESLAGDSESS